jgi:predicted HTH transcriptional regulator
MIKTLSTWIAEGEHEGQDFKARVPEAAKIARTLAAFANGKGGRLLVGITDQYGLSSISPEEEKHSLMRAAKLFCKPIPTIKYEEHLYKGKVILLALVKAGTKGPYKAPDEEGHWRIFIRQKDETIMPGPVVAEGLMYKFKSKPIVLTGQEGRLMDLLKKESASFETLTSLSGLEPKIVRTSLINLYASNLLIVSYTSSTELFGLKGLVPSAI